MFDELSVRNVFPKFAEDAEVMKNFQDEYPKNRFPDRNYFWTVLNTVHPEYVAEIVAHANAQRFTAKGEAQEHEVIGISEEWWEALNKLPYFSRKFFQKSNSLRF